MKKLFLTALLLLGLASPAFARTCTWDGGGGDNLASTAANWDTNTTCVAGDAVVFDGTSSKNATFDLTAAFASLNTTGYGGTVTASATITVSGSVTFANSTFANGSQKLIVDATSTINVGTAGNTLYDLTLGNSSMNGVTFTISNPITVSRNFALLYGNGTTNTSNGSTISIAGTVDFSFGNNSTFNGTTTFIVNGTGAQSLSFTSALRLDNPLTINKASNTVTWSGTARLYGAVTFTAGTNDFGTSTVKFDGSSSITYTAGTLTVSTSTMWFNSTITIPSGFITAIGTFYKVTVGDTGTSSFTLTLGNNMTISNTFQIYGGNGVTHTLNGYKIYIQGNFDHSYGNNVTNAGTTQLEISGSGTQTWTGVSTQTIATDVIINKSGGSVTWATDINYKTGTFTYTAGTFTPSTYALNIKGSCTLNTSGTSFYDVKWTATNTTTLSSLLTATHAMQSSAATTLAGTGGLSTATLTIDSAKSLDAAGNTITVTGNVTNSGTFTKGTSTVTFNGTSTVTGAMAFYNLTINSAKTVHLTSTTTYSSSGTFTASGCTLDATTPASRAILNITGAQSVGTVTATDIDSSGGSTVHNYVGGAGTNSNTVNWDTSAPAANTGNFFTLMGI